MRQLQNNRESREFVRTGAGDRAWVDHDRIPGNIDDQLNPSALKTKILTTVLGERLVAGRGSYFPGKDRNVIPTITKLADRTTSILYTDPLVCRCQSPAGFLPPTTSPLTR